MRGKLGQHACAVIITARYVGFTCTWWVLKETLPSVLQPGELQCACLVVQRHWLESCCSDLCPALRLQQCITPSCPVTGEIQQTWVSAGPTELDQVFLLCLCIDRHCRCLLKGFNVVSRPAAQPLMLNPSNRNLLKLHLRIFLLA